MLSSVTERPTLPECLMETAFVIAQRGTCDRRKVGAVIANMRGTVVSWAYNGVLAGLPHCAPHTDYNPCDVSEHAERNAIYWAARHGVALEGKQIFITDSPCYGCARAIIQSGLMRVSWSRAYRDLAGLSLLERAGIEVVRLEFAT